MRHTHQKFGMEANARRITGGLTRSVMLSKLGIIGLPALIYFNLLAPLHF
jgi:hypothetical protein